MFWASLRRSAMRRRMRFILTRVSAREASPAAAGGAFRGGVDLEERLAHLHHGIHLREVLRDRAGDGRPHLDAHLVRLDDDDDVVDGHAVADLRRPLDDGTFRDGVAHARHGDVFHAQQPREPAERRLLRFLGESERELPGGIAHSNGPCGAKARAARALHHSAQEHVAGGVSAVAKAGGSAAKDHRSRSCGGRRAARVRNPLRA